MAYQRIVITQYGNPEVLKLVREEELPHPEKGQVRIKVLTASACFTDTLIRRGIYPAVRKKPPFSPGYDLLGLVDQLGEGVDHLSVGQKVADLTVTGSYTEYLCLDAQSVVPVPDGLDDGEAVSMILTYLTAYQMLHRSSRLAPGQKVLIHACAGAVGTAMLQLGKLMNLRMYGTASRKKHPLIEAMGAIPIDYENEDFAEVLKEKEPDGLDAVFDPMGGDYFPRSLSVLRKKGTLVGYGYQHAASGNGGHVVLDFFKVLWWNVLPNKPRANFYVITSFRKKHPQWFREDLSELYTLLADGKIKPVIGKTMRLDQAAEAHALVEHFKVEGKVILKIT